MRIHQLPSLIANQIAAGEVIERPASVVKELLENSLDAGAHAICIEISYGGLNQIKISDNGSGIFAEDLLLSIAAHATSKISTLNDLYAIDSMGFRGEALASIASIAKVTISSKPAAQSVAMMLQVKGCDTALSPCARNVGTTIDVVDLFFNAPVRKRFLKSEKLEFQAIETVVKRFALSAPEIALTLKHNGKQILSLPAAITESARSTRMMRIIGNAFMKEAIYLDVERGDMRLHGWISGASFQRSQNDRQWVFINQRMVRDKLINHAIKQAYEEIMYPGRFPACVLYLSINHGDVDVNVHPTKHEVRFQQPRLVHDFFTSQLKMALQSPTTTHDVKNYELIHQTSESTQKICEPLPKIMPSLMKSHLVEAELTWTNINSQFILTFIEQQPYLVNFLALQQEVLYSQLSTSVLPLASRPLLVPMRCSLQSHAKDKIKNLNNLLLQLGILIEFSGENNALIRTIPVNVPHLDLRFFWEAMMLIKEPDLDQLLTLLSQSQTFDPNLLSQEEKKMFNQIMLEIYQQKNNKTGLFKALTLDACQNLLHV